MSRMHPPPPPRLLQVWSQCHCFVTFNSSSTICSSLPYERRFDRSTIWQEIWAESLFRFIQQQQHCIFNSINFRFPSIYMDNFKENITLEEISTQNGPPKKINKIIFIDFGGRKKNYFFVCIFVISPHVFTQILIRKSCWMWN